MNRQIEEHANARHDGRSAICVNPELPFKSRLTQSEQRILDQVCQRLIKEGRTHG